MHFSTNQIPLRTLIEQFNKEDISLPPWQRPFVWKIQKTLNLLDSLYRKYPIGVIYLWQPSQGSQLRPKKRTFRGRGKTILQFPLKYLIDGQQRLTALEAAFGLSEAFTQNGRTLECFLDLKSEDFRGGRDTRLFRSPAKKMTPDPEMDTDLSRLWIRDIWRCDSDADYHKLRTEREEQLRDEGWEESAIQIAMARIDAVQNILKINIPCVTISKMVDKQVVQVFKRLNGGAGLRKGDLRAADLGTGPSVDVLEQMRRFVQEDLPSRLGFSFLFAFRTLVVFHKRTARFNSLPPDWAQDKGLDDRSLKQSWESAEKSLRKAMGFVESEMGWSRRGVLPSANALIPFAFAIDFANGVMDERNKLDYKRWLCLTSLRGIWRGSVETTIDKFLRKFKDINNRPGALLLSALKKDQRRQIDADEEIDVSSPVWGPVTQIMLAWLVNINGKDWASGEKIISLVNGGDKGSRTGRITVHHIFPRKFLANLDYATDYINCPANYALLSGETNSKFKDSPPDEVLKQLDAKGRKSGRMQFFQSDAANLLKEDQYEVFCSWRAKQLAKALNEWLQLPIK